MSHFLVTVLLRQPVANVSESLCAALAPFQENNMGDCPKQFLEFQDAETEARQEWESEGSERIVLADGTYATPWDERFRVASKVGIGGDTHCPPMELERRSIPFKELYPSFEQFMRDYHGHDTPDPETGKFGYWENPNKKWDYWTVGGRWDGVFYKANTRDVNSPSPSENLFSNVIAVSKLPKDFKSFAVLTPDGEWIEGGKMGWWACVGDEKDADKWSGELKSVFSRFHDCLAVAVDCHI